MLQHHSGQHHKDKRSANSPGLLTECLWQLGAEVFPPLPDPDDIHLVQTVIAAGAAQILIFNVGHFPPEELAKADLELVHPDKFLFQLCELYSSACLPCSLSSRPAPSTCLPFERPLAASWPSRVPFAQ